MTHLADFMNPLIMDGRFQKNMITLARITPWIIASFQEVNDETIKKCFNKCLNLNIPEVDEEVESEEGEQDYDLLNDALVA